MNVKEIKFQGGKYGVYRVVVGNEIVGSFSYVGKPKEMPWKLEIDLPGIKGPFAVENEDLARELVKRAILSTVENLVEL